MFFLIVLPSQRIMIRYRLVHFLPRLQTGSTRKETFRNGFATITLGKIPRVQVGTRLIFSSKILILQPFPRMMFGSCKRIWQLGNIVLPINNKYPQMYYNFPIQPWLILLYNSARPSDYLKFIRLRLEMAARLCYLKRFPLLAKRSQCWNSLGIWASAVVAL